MEKEGQWVRVLEINGSNMHTHFYKHTIEYKRIVICSRYTTEICGYKIKLKQCKKKKKKKEGRKLISLIRMFAYDLEI